MDGAVIKEQEPLRRIPPRIADLQIGSALPRFSESQEGEVTTALSDHNQVRMKVKGRGEMSPQGKLLKITRVDEITIHPVGEVPFDRTARPIEDVIAELAAQVPQAEWDRLPDDLTDNLDHYLYGTPKRVAMVSAVLTVRFFHDRSD